MGSTTQGAVRIDLALQAERLTEQSNETQIGQSNDAKEPSEHEYAPRNRSGKGAGPRRDSEIWEGTEARLESERNTRGVSARTAHERGDFVLSSERELIELRPELRQRPRGG